MTKLLHQGDVARQLERLAGWRLIDQGCAITKTFVFDDFTQAFAFMTRIADKAEDMNHHPDWTNVYNRVSVRLSTHDAGGLTDKDFALALAMDESAGT